ncbi:MAG: hypothetical protein MUO70_04285 [Euryarchaeota archaeon]|jgi:hypothetical protein|nr:hypothetical protein [Euryarchaeota archaeon]
MACEGSDGTIIATSSGLPGPAAKNKPAYYTRQRKTLKGIAFFDVFVLLSRNPDVVGPTHDEKSGVYMCRVGVRRRSFRRMSIYQHDEPLHIGAELIEKRCGIHAASIHDARRE